MSLVKLQGITLLLLIVSFALSAVGFVYENEVVFKYYGIATIMCCITYLVINTANKQEEGIVR